MSWGFIVAGEAEDVKQYVEAQDEYNKKYSNDCPEWRACRDAIIALCDRVIAARPAKQDAQGMTWREGVYAKTHGHCDSAGNVGNSASLETSIVPIGPKATNPPTPTPAAGE